MLVEVNRTFGGSKAGNVIGEFDQHAIRLTEADAEIHVTTLFFRFKLFEQKISLMARRVPACGEAPTVAAVRRR